MKSLILTAAVFAAGAAATLAPFGADAVLARRTFAGLGHLRAFGSAGVLSIAMPREFGRIARGNAEIAFPADVAGCIGIRAGLSDNRF